MGEVTTIGLDLAKQVFHVHGADVSGAALFSRRLTRSKLLGFFASQPRCRVAMEACGGAHHWGRELERLGHEVRLIPPAYVKPFVKRQKNDARDAEAICEAAQRPGMRFVAVKDEERQASAALFRARDLLVRQRAAAEGMVCDRQGGVVAAFRGREGAVRKRQRGRRAGRVQHRRQQVPPGRLHQLRLLHGLCQVRRHPSRI